MFERFTEPARQVMVLAQQEARRLGRDHIGSEHILLGVVRQQQGVGAQVLRAYGITDDRLGTRLGETPWIGQMIAGRSLAFTARAQRALELAAVEAHAHGSEMISTHDLLLGLLREIDGGAVRVLFELGADPRAIAEQVLAELSAAPEEEWPASMQQLADFRDRRTAAPRTARVSRDERRVHLEQAISTAQDAYRRATTDRQRTLARERIELLESTRQLL
jgi:ATP-dependent Clp protease ATP-binding subunit ClpC